MVKRYINTALLVLSYALYTLLNHEVVWTMGIATLVIAPYIISDGHAEKFFRHVRDIGITTLSVWMVVSSYATIHVADFWPPLALILAFTCFLFCLFMWWFGAQTYATLTMSLLPLTGMIAATTGGWITLAPLILYFGSMGLLLANGERDKLWYGALSLVVIISYTATYGAA